MYNTQINGKVVVLGDTHGECNKTKAMLGYLAKNKIIDDRSVVFIGDFVDCGPDTSNLISLLLAFHKYHPNTTFLCGNHDLNLAKALNIVPSSQQDFYWNRIPERNGAVLKSYGAKDGKELSDKMPKEHKEFLANLPWIVEHPDYYFIHAGLDPKEPLEHQINQLNKRDADVYKPKWLYSNSLGYVGNSHQTDKKIITGHLNLNDVTAFDNRVIIDTGAGYGGKLTALLLPEMRYLQV